MLPASPNRDKLTARVVGTHTKSAVVTDVTGNPAARQGQQAELTNDPATANSIAMMQVERYLRACAWSLSGRPVAFVFNTATPQLSSGRHSNSSFGWVYWRRNAHRAPATREPIGARPRAGAGRSPHRRGVRSAPPVLGKRGDKGLTPISTQGDRRNAHMSCVRTVPIS
jgi:hypothetical protein